MRVLKPGGILASREVVTYASFVGPDEAVDDEAWSTFARLVSASGGHPDMGRNLKNAFFEAGFVDVEWSASFDVFSPPEDVAFFHAFVNE